MLHAILTLFFALNQAEQAHIRAAACALPSPPTAGYMAGTTGTSIYYQDGSQQITTLGTVKIYDQNNILVYQAKTQ